MRLAAVFLYLLLGGHGYGQDSKVAEASKDPFLWLEQIEDQASMTWVNSENQKTLDFVSKDQRFESLQKEALTILDAQDKIPLSHISGDYVYNHWQDAQHSKGLWRRQKLPDYVAHKSSWQVLLDIDQLATKWKMNLVFKGANCLAPTYQRCLLDLSNGGKDAVFVREFDLDSLTFAKDGFNLDEAKTSVAWLDRDHVLVGSDFGPGSLTNSGYARIIKLWQRGTPIAQAKTLFEADADDTWVQPLVENTPEGRFAFILRGLDFFRHEVYLINKKDQPVKLPLPEKSQVVGVFQRQLIVELKEDWQGHLAGALIGLDLESQSKTPVLTAIFKPDGRRFIKGVSLLDNSILVTFIENVTTQAAYFTVAKDGAIHETALSGNLKGTLQIFGSDPLGSQAFLTHEDFLTPPTLYLTQGPGKAPIKIQSLPERFLSQNLSYQQYFATSKDGTQVPYFVIGKKNFEKNSNQPTLQYGYGGFEISLLPSYMATTGKIWLERGGLYVLANIRGGGEYGPHWHQAALKHHRGRAYEDFFAVSQDLFRRKITSPNKLGIKGGSNGGLLMGVAMTQNPQYYQAVVCQVPLLDMMRFHKLLAGASWMAEYGNPDRKEDRDYLMTYSPYQVLGTKKLYPEALFMTSTKDDRVHPGHARKMAAKMAALGHKRYYYENIFGGHKASSNNSEKARMIAIEYVYLMDKLMAHQSSH